jgi:ubiquinone/menaquinone biosynthesis C-methylase UbiE
MARIAPFESHTRRYERWFGRHEAAYLSELRVLRELLPDPGVALEIGIGTGRFAEPLGITIGIDPSLGMLEHARRRRIGGVCAVAEALPFRHSAFDHALIVTTICFVDDARAMLLEAWRILKPGGAVVIGFIDRTSRLGRHYEAHRQESVFYRDAVFFSADEVDGLLSETGFVERTYRQTLTKPLAEMVEVEAPRPGFGDAAVVAVRAVKNVDTNRNGTSDGENRLPLT